MTEGEQRRKYVENDDDVRITPVLTTYYKKLRISVRVSFCSKTMQSRHVRVFSSRDEFLVKLYDKRSDELQVIEDSVNKYRHAPKL